MKVENVRTSWVYVTLPELIQCIQNDHPDDYTLQTIPMSGVGVEIGICARTHRLWIKWKREIPTPIGIGAQMTPGDAYSRRGT